VEASAQPWKKEETLLLISKYKNYQDSIDKGKIKKKVVWNEIAKQLNEKGYKFTGDQVCSRWKTIMRGYKAVKDSNKTSGSAHKTYEYESYLDDIFCDNPVISPIAIRSSTPSTSSNTSVEQSDEHLVLEEGPKKQRVKRLSSASQVVGIMKDYMDMQERRQREEAERRERMHEDKMKIFNAFIDAQNK
jgi:hypothetical protein